MKKLYQSVNCMVVYYSVCVCVCVCVQYLQCCNPLPPGFRVDRRDGEGWGLVAVVIHGDPFLDPLPVLEILSPYLLQTSKIFLKIIYLKFKK